jgi:DNA (cytosine-5)-methyltransferase 1
VRVAAGFCTEHSAKARSVGFEHEKSPTLRAGVVPAAVVYDARGNGDGETVSTITGDHNGHISDYTALAVEPTTMKIRAGGGIGGKGPLLQHNLSATLSTTNDQTLFVPVAYGISSYQSHAMLSANPTAGIYEAETSRTLDTGGASPSCNQGGIAVVDGAAYAMTTGNYMQVCEEKSPTLQARDYKDAPAVMRPSYTVRRLTPTECALLQGFPADYCSGLETPEPTEEDIAFWMEVWETHRRIVGKSSRPKSRNQIVKWLKNPHSDAAEYKMWGNGVSLPIIIYVLGGIAFYF